VQAISRHFDGLVRAAEVPAHTVTDHLIALRRELDRGLD
jgi:hypothetical protein